MRAKQIVHFNELKYIFCQVAVCAFLINGKNVSYLLEVGGGEGVTGCDKAVPKNQRWIWNSPELKNSEKEKIKQPLNNDGIQFFIFSI